MKRLLPFAPLLLLAAMLLSPAAALAGAKQGIDIWWDRVLPALLPSFICVRLAQELGLLRSVHRHTKGQLSAVIGFSLLSGAPNGAKLLHAMVRDGSLSKREAVRLLPMVNNVSPPFLISIIASELLKNKGLFLPMGLAFYGCSLCCIVPFFFHRQDGASVFARTKTVPFSTALISVIESSMLDMLRIGGCLLFICTLLSLCRSLMPGDGAYAALAGCMEVSIGTSVLSELALPLRVKVSLMTGVVAFGGLSLALQTLCCYPKLPLIPYLARKLLLGMLVGLVCYLLFPLFPSVSAAFASRQQLMDRSLTLSALLLSSLLSVAFMGVLSLMLPQAKYRK
ncbi:MAG: hypothetical protein IJI82_03200 [Clostridia bacterium]|nr:hypothetical protein [Clostridia bacterium]